MSILFTQEINMLPYVINSGHQRRLRYKLSYFEIIVQDQDKKEMIK